MFKVVVLLLLTGFPNRIVQHDAATTMRAWKVSNVHREGQTSGKMSRYSFEVITRFKTSNFLVITRCKIP